MKNIKKKFRCYSPDFGDWVFLSEAHHSLRVRGTGFGAGLYATKTILIVWNIQYNKSFNKKIMSKLQLEFLY